MTRTEVIYPRRSATTHTESLGDEASVYDWAQKQVHAFNPTAATVWRLCDGATSTDAIAEVLHREMGIPEAHAVVDLTLKKLASLRLLDLPVESLRERSAPSRRWLLGRGLATAMLPAVYTILTPSPLQAQSGAVLGSIEPQFGSVGTTVGVFLIGTGFVNPGTAVNISGTGVTVGPVIFVDAEHVNTTFQIAAAAPLGQRQVSVTVNGVESLALQFNVIA